MKIALYYLKGKSEGWAEEAAEQYAKKISAFFPFERSAVKSKSSEREQSDKKKRAEAAALLEKIKLTDFLVIFDEAGKSFDDSVDFSKELVRALGRQHSRIVFVIGGPYGFDESVKERAQVSWSLGRLTMNHHLAQIAALEQIYRALTIWRGIPYHNV